jgi:DNA-binding GntR family transcriptional regulator
MDFLTVVEPVALAQEHEPIVDALDQRDSKKVARLLASHSVGLVKYLQQQAVSKHSDAKPTPIRS